MTKRLLEGLAPGDETGLIQLVRDDIRQLSPYHVQASDGFVKLDAMENPYALPERVFNDWVNSLENLSFNRYPDPGASKLSALLKAKLNLPDDMAVLFGNGSDEIIQMLIMAVARENASVLTVEPSFVMYKMIAQFCRVHFIGIDLLDDFSLDMGALLAAVKQQQPSIVFLAQPNNPTGNLFHHEQICELIEASRGFVVIDEAYTAFTDYDGTGLLNKYSNVLVMRTFSKTGLAGVRLGYLLGRKEYLVEFNKVRLPYNVNVLTQSLAEVALKHFDLLIEQTCFIMSSRDSLFTELEKITQLEAVKSEANFITVRLVDVEKYSIHELFEFLKTNKILVKKLDGAHRLLANCLRLTVGSEEENRVLLAALKHFFLPSAY